MEDKTPEKFSWAARGRSFKYAFQGFGHFLRSQHNAWIHAVAAVVVLAAGWWLDISALEWCAIVLAIALVISAELMNTAIEFLVDLVSPEYNELAGKAKDVAAAGVLIMAIAAAIIGVIVFGPKLLDLFYLNPDGISAWQ